MLIRKLIKNGWIPRAGCDESGSRPLIFFIIINACASLGVWESHESSVWESSQIFSAGFAEAQVHTNLYTADTKLTSGWLLLYTRSMKGSLSAECISWPLQQHALPSHRNTHSKRHSFSVFPAHVVLKRGRRAFFSPRERLQRPLPGRLHFSSPVTCLIDLQKLRWRPTALICTSHALLLTSAFPSTTAAFLNQV